MPLPAIPSIVVETKATAYYLSRIAATMAGGDPPNFMLGTVIVGDGDIGAGPDIPPISDLITAGGVRNEQARGSWVQAVVVNSGDAEQTDVLVVIPAEDEAGDPIPAMWVTEYAITDELGEVCLVGTTAVARFTAESGVVTDVAFIAAEKVSNGIVELSPPSATFVTHLEMLQAINANVPDATAPLTKTDTTLPSGYLRRVFGLRAATKPADAATNDAANTGYGRPASDAEYAAGTPIVGGFAFPWPTLTQVKNAIAAAANFISGVGVTIRVTGGGKALDIDYATLPSGSPLLDDELAFYRPTATAGKHKRNTLAAVRDAIVPPPDPGTLVKKFALAAPLALANGVATKVPMSGSAMPWVKITSGSIEILEDGIYSIKAYAQESSTSSGSISITWFVSIVVNGVQVSAATDNWFGTGVNSGWITAFETTVLQEGDLVDVYAYNGNPASSGDLSALTVVACDTTVVKLR